MPVRLASSRTASCPETAVCKASSTVASSSSGKAGAGVLNTSLITIASCSARLPGAAARGSCSVSSWITRSSAAGVTVRSCASGPGGLHEVVAFT